MFFSYSKDETKWCWDRLGLSRVLYKNACRSASFGRQITETSFPAIWLAKKRLLMDHISVQFSRSQPTSNPPRRFRFLDKFWWNLWKIVISPSTGLYRLRENDYRFTVYRHYCFLYMCIRLMKDDEQLNYWCSTISNCQNKTFFFE